jgi:sodium-dependent dicarboxylate transporter 2/3/5
MLGQSIMLSIAYGANVGGIGTMIGTAPNMLFAGFVNTQYKTQITFVHYLGIGLPFVVLFLPLVFLALAILCRKETVATFSADIVRGELAKLGPMSVGEKQVLTVFLLTSSAWILNQPIRLFAGVPDLKPDIFDASFAMTAGLALFSIGTLRASSLRRMPWDALLLLGGSFALAEIVQKGGLSGWLAVQMKDVGQLQPLVLMFVVTTVTVFMSAFSSNTATANVMMLLVSDTLDPKRADPGRVVPYLSGVTIAASCDFMLPAGTPPNAIVFATHYVRMRTMAMTGFFLDLAAALLVALWVTFGAGRLL